MISFDPLSQQVSKVIQTGVTIPALKTKEEKLRRAHLSAQGHTAIDSQAVLPKVNQPHLTCRTCSSGYNLCCQSQQFFIGANFSHTYPC